MDEAESSRRFRIRLGVIALATPTIGLPIMYVAGDQLYGQMEPDIGAFFFGAFFVLGALGVLIVIARGRLHAKKPRSAMNELANAVETLGFISMHFMGFVCLLYYGSKLSPEPVFSGVAQPTMHEIVIYSLDQGARGILFDLMESYGFRIGGLEHNTGNIAFASIVFVFRTVFSAVGLNAFLILMRNMLSRRATEAAA